MTGGAWSPAEAWRRLRLEAEAAKHYHLSYSMYLGQTHRDPLLEKLLPTLLYVKAVAVLDDALGLWLSENGHHLSRPYRDNLHGRLCYLGDSSLLPDVAKLHEIRQTRNDLAHTPGASTKWDVMIEDLGHIEQALLTLGLAKPTPKLEYFYERSAMQASDEPGVDFSREFSYGVKEDGHPGLEIAWTQKFLTK